MIVRLISSNVDCQHLLFQTPDHSGIWNSSQFTLDSVTPCDYAIVLNSVPEDTLIHCPKTNIWQIIMEPPVPEFNWFYQHSRQFCKIFTPDMALQGKAYIPGHGAIPWYIKKDYDFLRFCLIPEKPRVLSWVTDNETGIVGQRQRMTFLQNILDVVEFDLWGRAFTPLDDKWDGIAPYRYSLAIENYSGPHYWSEKIADCFLGYTMPIYYGCTNVSAYFPEESYVWIDITQPQKAIEVINETIVSDLWRRNRDAIVYARELVLEKYQLFPFLAQQIHEHEAQIPPVMRQKHERTNLRKTIPPEQTLWFNILNQCVRTGRYILPQSVRKWMWETIGRFLYKE